MNCPHCKEALKRIKYANANVRECPNCKGMLLATSRAEKIKRRVNKDVRQLMKEVTTIESNDGLEEIRCPACRDKMDKQLVKHLGNSTNVKPWFFLSFIMNTFVREFDMKYPKKEKDIFYNLRFINHFLKSKRKLLSSTT